jgi:hypothetical protein
MKMNKHKFLILSAIIFAGLAGCQSSKTSKPETPPTENLIASTTPVVIAEETPPFLEPVENPTGELAQRLGLWEKRVRISFPKDRSLILYYRVHIDGKLSLKRSGRYISSFRPTKKKENSIVVGVSIFDPNATLPPKHYVSTCKIDFHSGCASRPQWIDYSIPEGHTSCGQEFGGGDAGGAVDAFRGGRIVKVMSVQKSMLSPAVVDPKNPKQSIRRPMKLISVELFVQQGKKQKTDRKRSIVSCMPFSNEGLPKYYDYGRSPL